VPAALCGSKRKELFLCFAWTSFLKILVKWRLQASSWRYSRLTLPFSSHSLLMTLNSPNFFQACCPRGVGCLSTIGFFSFVQAEGKKRETPPQAFLYFPEGRTILDAPPPCYLLKANLPVCPLTVCLQFELCDKPPPPLLPCALLTVEFLFSQ